MSDQPRCGNCRFYAPPERAPKHVDGFCLFTLPDSVPFWVKAAMDFAHDDVEPDDGADCDAWEAKP